MGARVLLDDGAVEVGDSHGEVVCRVQNQGVLGNKKGECRSSVVYCAIMHYTV